MGNVTHCDFGGAEVPLTKTQLAKTLNRSRRWVELRVREGMPSALEGNRRMFLLSETRAWMHNSDVKAGPPRQVTEGNGDQGSAAEKRERSDPEQSEADIPDSSSAPPPQGGTEITAALVAELRRIISQAERRIAQLEAGESPPPAA